MADKANMKKRALAIVMSAFVVVVAWAAIGVLRVQFPVLMQFNRFIPLIVFAFVAAVVQRYQIKDALMMGKMPLAGYFLAAVVVNVLSFAAVLLAAEGMQMLLAKLPLVGAQFVPSNYPLML